MTPPTPSTPAGPAGPATPLAASSAPVVPTPADVATAYREGLDPKEKAALLSWLGFATTFAVVRGITYSIKDGRGPFRNLSVGGAHLHHYMWGIGMLAGVGAVAVRGDANPERHPAIGLTYGAGLALIVDEFALLLDLQDVYWARQGRVSVDLGVGLVAGGGTFFASIPLLRRLRHNRGH